MFFRGQKNAEQEESQVTEEFNVTNTMELNQELEKEPNLEYNYEEEEEEEEENEEQEKAEEEKGKNNNDNKSNGKEDEKEIKKEIKDNKDNILNEENKDEDNFANLGMKYIDNDNTISTNGQEEENKKIEKIENKENKKEPIIEEIDTTVPKNNIEEENDNENNIEKQNDDNIIIKGISPNTICHRIIPKGLDIDISNKVYFKCYKIKTKSGIISFLTGSKKVKIPYLIFLDENFYYMLKDKPVNQTNENIRRIGNRYDLLKLSNFQTRKINDDYEFAFEFLNEDYFDRIYKLLYFEPKEAEVFFDVFQQYSNNLGLDLPTNIMMIEDREEEEEGEEEEDYGEEEEKEGGEEKEEQNNEEIEGEEEEEDEKEIKNDKIENENNKDKDKENKEENDINKKEENETISTKEESKEIRDVEVIN